MLKIFSGGNVPKGKFVEEEVKIHSAARRCHRPARADESVAESWEERALADELSGLAELRARPFQELQAVFGTNRRLQQADPSPRTVPMLRVRGDAASPSEPSTASSKLVLSRRAAPRHSIFTCQGTALGMPLGTAMASMAKTRQLRRRERKAGPMAGPTHASYLR